MISKIDVDSVTLPPPRRRVGRSFLVSHCSLSIAIISMNSFSVAPGHQGVAPFPVCGCKGTTKKQYKPNFSATFFQEIFRFFHYRLSFTHLRSKKITPKSIACRSAIAPANSPQSHDGKRSYYFFELRSKTGLREIFLLFNNVSAKFFPNFAPEKRRKRQ